jgi:hypothetical protein
MAIVVKSGGNPAPALVGAYAGGMGKRRAEDERQQAALIAAKEAQQRSIAAQQQESALSREFTLDRDEAGQERSLETMQASADLREGAAESEQLRRREDVKWGYTASQKQTHDRLTEALANLQADPDMTERQKIEGADQIKAQLYSIKPVEKLAPKQITPEERLKTSTTTLKDGTVVAFKPDGTAHVLVASPESKQAESQAKDRDAALKQATEELNDASGKGDGTRPTMDAKIKRAREILKEMRELQRLDEGGQATDGAAGDDSSSKTKPVSVKAPNGKVFTARK